MISLFIDNDTEQATLLLRKELEKIDFPEGLDITINNRESARSGILRKDGQIVEISLANCFTLQDVIREMARMLQEPRYDDWEEVPKL